jgi:hypothetical protein
MDIHPRSPLVDNSFLPGSFHDFIEREIASGWILAMQ